MARALRVSPVASDRIAVASAWLEARRPGEQVLVVGATIEAAHALVRSVVARRGSAFGWHRASLGSLAMSLALDELAARRLVPAGALVHEALAARVLSDLAREGALGRFAQVADSPRLPRAVASTLDELRMASLGEVAVRAHDPTLARTLAAAAAARDERRLADRASVLALATAVAADPKPRPLLDGPLLLLDVSVSTAAERELVAALVARSPDALATVPGRDERNLSALERAFGCAAETCEPIDDGRESTEKDGVSSVGSAAPLRRVAHFLFDRGAGTPAETGTSVSILSAPGERRECTEIAREILREAASGTRFDHMAVVLHRPAQYRDHLDQALRRAGIPAHFARGTSRPHPAGRALLALLACAAEGLSARRFAEYLSLAEVPDADAAGSPPVASVEWVPADDELAGDIAGAHELDEDDALSDPSWDDDDAEAASRSTSAPVVAGTLRVPRRWEQLLVDAAVIGGRDRWIRRLDGLVQKTERTMRELEDGPDLERAGRRLVELAALRHFALPLLEELESLRAPATWGEWIDRLGRLASRALRHPRRVLACLADLRPMASVGPVGLAEVRRVLAPRLAELVRPVIGSTAGKVLVLAVAAVRGRCFEVVFVPGLAERLFPSKLTEDPILRDEARAAMSHELVVEGDRVERERLALRLCIGAATRRIVLSYPRMDLDQARPRVPSFYGLEVVRAAEGRLPGFDELARRAEQTARTRIGWPAPDSPLDAIDDAEHDLALLDALYRRPEAETRGAASYLLGTNAHLARALRARGRRWLRRWGPNDGLVIARDASPAVRAALAEHAFDRRAFSATALEKYAKCPYSFFLNTVHRLRAREVPEAIEEMDPLSRGSLTHEAQFATLVELRSRGWLPITQAKLPEALAVLDRELDAVAERFHDDLAPAIERVWQDGVSEIRADLREWLHRTAHETAWVPWRFELSFGLPAEQRESRDAHSQHDPVTLANGLRLRGSIDLVEETPAHDALRATDHKTGKAHVAPGAVVFGGTALQPLLYAMALEALFPDRRVDSGRLSYCTVRGDYEERTMPLDPGSRAALGEVLDTIRGAIEEGFLPAAPRPSECRWCDYARVCGPHEEQRVAKKPPEKLRRLVTLRGMP